MDGKMTNENNVKKNSKLDSVEPSRAQSERAVKQRKRKKVRLHSRIQVNVPLTQSLMLILPSLAKHDSAETTNITETVNIADDVTSENQKSVNNQESTARKTTDISKDQNQKPITRNILEPEDTIVHEHTSQGGGSTLRPSHHLSNVSHPQVHYVPASSLASIEPGGVVTPSNKPPTTPSVPVTFTQEVIKGTYGELHVDASGKYTFVLNPLSPQYILLHQNQPGTDKFVLHLSNGSSVVVQIPVAGKQDSPSISGDLHGIVTEDRNADSNGLLNAAGKIDVVDPDHDQSAVIAETIIGKYGTLTIDANGAWHYQVDNSLPNIQALTSLTSLHESFVIHTIDGTPQSLEMTIGGIDDNAVVTGLDSGTLIEDATTHIHGQLAVSDSDLNQDHFQAEQLQGHWGNLSIRTDGSWTYDLDNTNPKIQSLAKGSTETDIITVHSADGTPHQITLTISGTNDAATVSSASVAFSETDTHITTSGTLTSTDIDNPDNAFIASLITGNNGDLTIDANGHWVFTANSAFNQLNVGDKVEETFTVASVDGTQSTIKVTINGTNDAATVSSATVSVDETDSAIITSGALTSTDIDNPDNAFTPDSITGTHGNLTIDANGHWVFTANSAFNQLNVGDKVEETFTVTSIDGTPSTIKITINGTDDKAVISGVSTDSVKEDIDPGVNSYGNFGGSNYASSHWHQLTITDSDNSVDQVNIEFGGKTVTWQVGSPLDIQTNYGKFELTTFSHGPHKGELVWLYNGDNRNPSIQGLKEGESLHESITLVAPDGTRQSLSVEIKGTEDHVVIDSPNHLGDVIEDQNAGAQITGQLLAHDTDTHDSVSWTVTQAAGKYGDFSVDADGNWQFIVDQSKAISLGEGDEWNEHFTIEALSTDGSKVSKTVTVVVHGSNDAPTVTGGLVLTQGIEDKQVILTQQDLLAHASDSDRNDQGWLRATHLSADHGSISTNADGSFTFTPEKDYNGDVHFTYDVIDRHGGATHTDATINLVAVNDASVLANALSSNEVIEDHLSGSSSHTLTSYWKNLDITDTDAQADAQIVKIEVNGVEHSVPANFAMTLQGAHGSFVTTHGFDGHNKWRYIADNNHPEIQQLKDGQSLTDHMTLITADGTRIPITATIKGTDDSVIIDTPDSLTASIGTAIEDQKTSLSGTLQAHDVDKDDSVHFQTQNLTGNFGSFSVAKDGTWHYQLDPAKAQHLTAGQNQTEGFDIVAISSDGSTATQHIQINVQGSNDSAIIAGVDTGSVTENSAGKDMSPDYAQPGMAHLGRNPLYASGTLTISDVDSGEAAFNTHGVGFTYSGKFGDLLLQENGQWTYYADAGGVRIKGGYASNRGSTIDRLGEGQSLTDTITVYSKDGTSHDIVITIHGSNDRPYCSSEVVLANGSEDTRQTLTTAQLLANTVDVDKNDAGLLSIENLHADHGSILNNADGTFTFTPEKDYNGDVHFTYDVKDAHGGITHTGASTNLAAVDDKTVFGGVSTDSVKEDIDPGVNSYGNFGGSNYASSHWHQLTITDSDNSVDQVNIEFGGKTVTWQVGSPLDIQTNYGKFELTTFSHGPHKGELVWLYNGDNRNPSIQGLKEGESLHESITLVAPDGTRQSLSVEIKGTEDHVVIDSPNHLGDVIEDQNAGAQITGQLLAHDTDTHDSVSWTVTQTAGKYGDFSVDADGNWQFIVDQSKAISLGEGDEWNEHFTIEALSTDGSKVSKTVTVVVHGSNDAPTVTGGLVLTQGIEDKQVILTQQDLLAHASDSDRNDQGWLRATHLSADHGSISTNADGSFTFTPEKDYNGDVHFTYDVIDRHGGVTPTDASMNLAAVADSASFSGQLQGEVIEDKGMLSNNNNVIEVSGHIFVNDPDAGEQGFRYGTGTKINDPFDGVLHISANGTWTYDVHNDKLQHLSANEEVLVTHRVYSKDGSSQDIVIKVTGTNDKPVVTEVQQGPHVISEDSNHDVSGQITISDVDHSDQHSVTIDSQHQPQYGSVTYNSNTQTWVYTLNNSNSHVNALNNGEQLTDKFSLLVDDGHGGVTTQEVEMRIDGHSDVPPMPTLVAPAKITGSAGNQNLHVSIGVPPIIHQGTPTSMTGWGISDGHGHSLTTLHGQFGTLHVNPATGELNYDYQQSSGVVKTHTGGSYGSGTDETDSFVLTLGGDQNSQVAVHLHLHSQSVHGNSGHHIDQTTLTGMDLSPIAPPPPPPAPGMSQADEPDASFSPPDEVTHHFDEVTANLEHTAIGEHEQRSGAHAYLDALGINVDSSSMDSPLHHEPMAQDIDIIFSEAESASEAEQTDDGMSDGASHHADNPSMDDSLHHHNDVDGLPDIDPNN
ncbi:VCBS domain-containing protein [Enterovibrio sp. 27052020O]|uniref:VCBS domain-containing protein n=1 Tax=Enterovibrio sp. 27052020O TaxID=3241166 RepID=UPI00388FF6BB